MTIDDARIFVNQQIARIQPENPAELRPWYRDVCPAASEHWGRVQQRIALSHPHPQRMACCQSLQLTAKERTPAQILAAEANGRRLAARAA
jgi:hypothetical protein